MAHSIHTFSTGMARAWDAQGESTVHISGQATMVLGRQHACDLDFFDSFSVVGGVNAAGKRNRETLGTRSGELTSREPINKDKGLIRGDG